MKTRIIKISKGYVPQVFTKVGSRKFLFFWTRAVYSWVGIDKQGYTHKPVTTQLYDCYYPTKERAEAVIKEYENKERFYTTIKSDLDLLSSD